MNVSGIDSATEIFWEIGIFEENESAVFLEKVIFWEIEICLCEQEKPFYD